MDPRIIVIAVLAAIFLRGDSPARDPRARRREANPDADVAPSDASETNPVETASRYPDGGLAFPDASPRSFTGDAGVSDAFVRTLRPEEAIRQITQGVCTQLTPCQDGRPGMDEDACERAFRDSTDLNRLFGLPRSLGFEAAVGAGNRAVTVHGDALEQCLAGIMQVSCEDVAADRREWEESIAGIELEPGETWANEDPFSFNTVAFHEAEELRLCREVFEREPVTCELDPSRGALATNAVGQLATTLCSRMSTCNPAMECDRCITGVLGSTTAVNFGLSAGTLGGIEWGLGTGLYQVNQAALTQCLSDLQSLSCGSTPEGFRTLRYSIPHGHDSCGEVFTEPHETCAAPAGNPALQLVAGLCTQLVYCRPELDCQSCIQGVLATNSLSDNFGLSPRLTMQQVVDMASRREATLNSENLAECLTQLEDMTCGRFFMAWNSRLPRNFRNVERVLYGSTGQACRTVFSRP